jgi:hypothetical protein
MASVTVAAPTSVRNVVSSTMVRGRYRRVTSAAAAGRIDQWPASSPRIRANTAGPSNRG